MGEIRTRVKLTNAVDEALSRRGKLAEDAVRTYVAFGVVDTGAVRSIIPVHVLEKLGLAIRGQRVAEYADGRKESVGVTEPLIIELEGRDTMEEALVLGDEILIGQTVLEKLDLLADCANHRVLPNPAHPDQPVSKVKMTRPPQKPVLGLVGAIGSGKSLVADALKKQGGYLISGDYLGHEALYQPDIRPRVVERFGKDITDDEGNILRRKLGAKVFNSRADLESLEALVFPFIEKRIEEEIELGRAKPEAKFIVLDAAIMMETGWDRVCDKLIYVDAPRPLRLERVARQRGWQEKEVAAREQMQMDPLLKRKRADFVVENAGPPEQIPGQVRDILAQLSLSTRSA